MIDDGPPRDHAPEPEHQHEHEHEHESHDHRPGIEDNIKSGATWMRLLFMIVMVLIYGIARIVLAATVIIQFFVVLFTGATNQPLKHLGEQLARYVYQIIRFLTFNTEERPFPFDLEWPTTRAPDRPED